MLGIETGWPRIMTFFLSLSKRQSADVQTMHKADWDRGKNFQADKKPFEKCNKCFLNTDCRLYSVTGMIKACPHEFFH